MWSTPAPTTTSTQQSMHQVSYAYGDERRRSSNPHKYARSSGQHSSGSSSFGGYSTSGFSQPSPSSSVSTASSSLRTPPDLLLNGATLATSLTSPAFAKAQLLGKGRDLGYSDHRSDANSHTQHYMSVAQLEGRLKLLERVSHAPVVSDVLPSPPACSNRAVPRTRTASQTSNSPPLAAQQTSSALSRTSQKRKALGDAEAGEMSSASPPDARRARRSSRDAAYGRDMNAHTASPSPSVLPHTSETLPLPRVRDWTKDRYFDTAKEYRHQGRELKHRGDRRLRESSTQLTSPLNEALIASLEQTDALLLYTYGFWCEDQGGGTCVTANWNSLFGLLKYVYNCHERSRMHLLSGLCRLLEASVLRHIAAHEMRMLNHRMGKVSSTAETPTRSEMNELSSLMTKVVGDQERSYRLAAQARQTILNMPSIQQQYPRLAQFCSVSMNSTSWMVADQSSLAMRLDPSCTHDGHDQVATPTNAWSWPLDAASPFPMLVCFGRAILREAAREAGVQFITEPVPTR